MLIETERLLIREFTASDLDAIHQVLDLDLKMEERSRDERESWLRWTIMNYGALRKLHQPPYGDRAVVLKTSQALIGAVGYVPCLMPFGVLPHYTVRLGRPLERGCIPEVGLFWAVGSAYQGNGYATEAARRLINRAFNEMALQRIVATTEYHNERSIAVMRRLGMVIEHNPAPEPFWFQVVGILENSLSPLEK